MGKPLPSFFLDANILFSAAYCTEGRCAALFALARKKRCRLVTSRFAVEEARRNLSDKKPECLKVFSTLVAALSLCSEAKPEHLEKAAAIGLDRGDIPILGAAIDNAEFMVTGDRKHFGPWMGETVYGLEVMGLAETLEALLLK